MTKTKTMLHVNDLKLMDRCVLLEWNSRNHPLDFEGYYHLTCSFSSLYKQFLHIEDAPSTHVGAKSEDTLKLLEEHSVICSARFDYDELRIKIPVLIQKEDFSYKAIYPHLSKAPKEQELFAMYINKWVAAQYGIDIRENTILYINGDYVLEEELDPFQLLKESAFLFNKRNNPSIPIDERLNEMDLDVQERINQAKRILLNKKPEMQRQKACLAQRRCLYYDMCFNDTSLPDDSILFLSTSNYKIDAFLNGVERICEIYPAKLEGYALQYAQYKASQDKKPFIDKASLQHWMSDITYPISYLDFEWDTFAFPPYKGMKPFEVLCFQYSLHIENEDGSLEHKDFFKTEDCREDFIQSLIDNVPKQGTILVYNMEGAEKLRLKQLACQFPQYGEDLKQIYTRMKDLSKPFENGIYYDSAQRGHYSLKSVLPIFESEHSYSNLQIQNGLSAVKAYRHYDQLNHEEKEAMRKDLKEYCGLDTYAEYIVYHGLKKALKPNA